jgi:hypothetical protein
MSGWGIFWVGGAERITKSFAYDLEVDIGFPLCPLSAEPVYGTENKFSSINFHQY